MTNEEIANDFRSKVPERAPRDYFDRSVDLALYFNDTIPEGKNRARAIYALRDAMVEAYKERGDGQSETILGDQERTNTR